MTLVDRAFRPLSTTAAVRLLERAYGLDPSAVRSLPGERAQNFHARCASGDEYTLKICPPDETIDFIHCQHAALECVATRSTGVRVPRPVPDVTGELVPFVDPTETDGTGAGAGADPLRVRLLTFVPGRELATLGFHTPDLLESVGSMLAKVDAALAGFEHEAARRNFVWDITAAPQTVRRHFAELPDGRRARVESIVDRFETVVVPHLGGLRRSVIHNDANDYNVLARGARTPDSYRADGLIDFGDLLECCTAVNVSVAAAYAMLDKRDPVSAAARIVGGYHAQSPLQEDEVGLLYEFMRMRLALSVVVAAYQRSRVPDNEYLSVSENQAWDTLARLERVSPTFAHYRLRAACNLEPSPQGARVRQRIARGRAHRVVDPDPAACRSVTLDLTPASPELATLGDVTDAHALSRLIFGVMEERGAELAVGRYDEPRMWYAGEMYDAGAGTGEGRRTIHLGIDLFARPGTPVYAPHDGFVHSFANNGGHLDYGPTIVLRHVLDADTDPVEFFTLYGHLTPASLDGLKRGAPVTAGETIGALGDYPENGNWAPHLHLQVICDMLGNDGDFPGVGRAGERETWTSLCPDPGPLIGIDTAYRSADAAEVLQQRRERIGASLSVSYDAPIHIVSGRGQYLFDAVGKRYLDLVNNVCHVGHCHPAVVAAGQRQMAILNTNTRYLHERLIEYATRLGDTMPDPLSVCFLTCSGSEANELALRLARAATGHRDVLVLEAAYHGNTTSLIDMSPYKHDGPGGGGAPPWVHTLDLPDAFRGKHRGRDAGAAYVADAVQCIERARESGAEFAAFMAESLPGCGGQIVLPDGYLTGVYEAVQRAGGVCVADEVQVGFGRVGTHWWGFETQGVVPDIVTLGKPMGNGHPMGAVVTTPDIAAAFDNGMEYFNTFGGNPVSCSIGMAVLDVIEGDGLRERARVVGATLMRGLRHLQTKHPVIGDVRGLGLFIGIELVRDRESLTPAADEASYVVERLKESGVLLSTDGPDHNVIKIKPPLVVQDEDATRFLNALDGVLAELDPPPT